MIGFVVSRLVSPIALLLNVKWRTIGLRKVTGLGHKITLDVAETARIGDVKSEIESRTSLPVSYQQLMSRGGKLDDDDATLTNYY